MKYLRKYFFLLVFTIFIEILLSSETALAAEMYLDGAKLSLPWIAPFVCMLLSIALFPVFAPTIWHHHFGKISIFWALAFLVPFALFPNFGPALAFYEFLHAILLEYIPFIVLLFALFTVAGGIRLKGELVGTPLVNFTLLLVGTALASWMGTTGAAMLLIRPLLRANANRKYRIHSVVFFIFLVANIGGCLTPLGDPPLFLGFLQGVGFFWTLTHLLPLMLFLSAILLILYFIIDTVLYKKELRLGVIITNTAPSQEKLGIEGGQNFLLLICIIAAVLMSGVWKPGTGPIVYHIQLEWQNIARDLILLFIAGISLVITNKQTREANEFSWEPIAEVGKIFLGIFLSMIPAIAILKAGESGALAPIIALVNDGGHPHNIMYFWLSGGLSSFLDNAPTYLVFFNTAAGTLDPSSTIKVADALMRDMPATLLAISAGAVFMGANTYIGNAPNFMVRSIAEGAGVRMPSFFGYMAWSCAILIPIFIIMTFIFF